jgi:hypothetical protein
MKKRWFVGTLLVGVLALSLTGGTVLAQEGGTDTDAPGKNMVSRVATILGLDETQIQDAFKQAAGDMQDEAVQRKLNHMLENGRLTQEEADAYGEWYQSKPEGLFPGKGFGGHGFSRGGMMGGNGRHGMGHWEQLPPKPESTETTLF